MKRPTLWMHYVVPLGLVAVLSGCGSSAAPTTTSVATNAKQTITVTTNTAQVQGASETVLATKSGMTLYYFTPDSPTASQCTGGCSQIWPPLLASGQAIHGSSAVTGSLAVIHDGNGNQVTYNGHPLYTYTGDTTPHQANGEGLYGKWYVATPQLASNANTGPATSTSTSSSSSSGSGW